MREYCEAESTAGGVAWCAMKASQTHRSSGESRAAAASGSQYRQSPPASGSNLAAASVRDFDFLHGEWVVANRRVLDPMTCTENWIGFDAVYACRPLLNGLGNIDEVLSDDFGSGAVLRLFDPQAESWSIHRVSSQEGVLRPPLKGVFEDGVGVFVGEDRIGSRPLLVRHTWRPSTEAPRWEQAFSFDAGRSWVTNWVMDLARVDWG